MMGIYQVAYVLWCNYYLFFLFYFFIFLLILRTDPNLGNQGVSNIFVAFK